MTAERNKKMDNEKKDMTEQDNDLTKEDNKEDIKPEGKSFTPVAEKIEDNGQKGEYKSEEKSAKTQQYYYVDEYAAKKKKSEKSMPGWLQFIIIFAAVILGLVILTSSCTNRIEKAFDTLSIDELLSGTSSEAEQTVDGEYIGVLHIEGTIDEDAAGKDYNHQLILDSIDEMIDDENNKGIILYLNTPGGSVYGSDDVYFRIKKYQKETGRPVYSSMQSQCCSGGYYISAPCDKIVANRNCWTGSIGVTIGTIYDITELLDNLGVKAVTITAGENKAMGSYTEKLTKEQQEILQTLVNEAYEQFTGIVAEGRSMSLRDVKKLADGRVYTAKQAKELGLVDEIGTYEECIEMMKKDFGLSDDVEIKDFVSKDDVDIYSLLGIMSNVDNNKANSGISSKSELEELLAMNGKIEISYMSTITK